MKLVSGFGAFLSLLVLTSCSSRADAPPKLPVSVSPGWQLKSIEESRPESAPETVKRLGFRKSWRAEYGGAGKAHVDIFALKTEAAGLEMAQQWRPRADSVTFFNPQYFVVIAWEKADRAALTALVSRIEKSLPASD